MLRRLTVLLPPLVLLSSLSVRSATAQVTVLDQPQLPTGLIAITGPVLFVSDSGCGSGNAPVVQALAENFAVTAPVSVDVARWQGGYQALQAPSSSVPFTLVFHTEDPGGLPGPVIATIAATPTQTLLASGTILGQPQSAYSFEAQFPPVALVPGNYFVEIFETDSTTGDCFRWSLAADDPPRSLPGEAFSNTAPGAAWTADVRADQTDTRLLFLGGTTGVAAIPTLAEWGLGGLVAGLGLAGLRRLRRRRI